MDFSNKLECCPWQDFPAKSSVYGWGKEPPLEWDTWLFTNFRNKLECLSQATLSSQVKCLWVRPGAYSRVEHLKAPAYYKNMYITAVKSFMLQGPVQQWSAFKSKWWKYFWKLYSKLDSISRARTKNILKSEHFDFIRTFMCYLSPTWILNKLASALSPSHPQIVDLTHSKTLRRLPLY